MAATISQGISLACATTVRTNGWPPVYKEIKNGSRINRDCHHAEGWVVGQEHDRQWLFGFRVC